MKLINNGLSLLLLLAVASSISVNPANAKKQFSKEASSTGGGAKSALGENTVTMPSGVQYKDIKVGTGPETKWGRTVWIEYKGWVMPDMKEFDSTVANGRPFNLLLGGAQICPGLDEGLKGMKQGGKRLLLLPPELAFPKGSATSRVIPPNSVIKYEVEVIHVGGRLPKKPVEPDKATAATGKPAGKAPAAPPAKTAPKSK